MSSRRDFETTLTGLAAIRSDPHSPGAADELRRALVNRSNLIVARAAEIVVEWQLSGYEAAMARAFDWFMTDAERRDPTCAAKIALAEALVAADYGDTALYTRGLRHFQLEPVWGGREDTAARLRATCALGLARANPPDTLLQLATLLADPETDARVGAARAMAQAARPGAAPLLWYKSLAGDAEVAPLFECFGGLLALEPEAALPHVGRFLQSPNVALAEAAAAALGESRLALAGPLLRDVWATTDEPALRPALLRALASLRDDEAFAFLLDLVAAGSAADAHDALAALAVFRDDVRRWRKVERAAQRRGRA